MAPHFFGPPVPRPTKRHLGAGPGCLVLAPGEPDRHISSVRLVSPQFPIPFLYVSHVLYFAHPPCASVRVCLRLYFFLLITFTPLEAYIP